MTNKEIELIEPIKRAVILFGHGARNPAWATPMQSIAMSMRKATACRVELAFLEFLQPSLGQVCAQLFADGIRQVQVKPVFLAGAGHLINDLPGILAAINQEFPNLKIEQMSALGDRPEVIEAISKSFLSEL
jgi:sirohydrochlorin cobaltochelatase